MNKKRLHLSETDLKDIEDTITHSAEKEVVKRAMALRLLHHGQHPDEIADMFMVTTSTVYNWRKRWLEDGLAGLVNKSKSGRPRKATDHYCTLLDEALARDPDSYGYAFTIWTLDRPLCQKQDPEAKAQAVALIEELKKGQNVVISSFSLWTKRASA